MVGQLLLLKMLHCKRTNKKNKQNHPEETVFAEPFKEEFKPVKVKNELESFDELESQVCRVCLKEGSIPLYGDHHNSENKVEDLIKIAGVEIERHDEFPKYLCYTCHSLLQGAILLRKTAQQSDIALRKHSARIPFDVHNDSQNTLNDFVYEDEQKPIVEEATSHVAPTYHCKRCELDFNTFEDYQEHKMTEEHETKKKECPYCHKIYNAVYIKRHLLRHTAESLFICDICGKKFTVQGHFSRHRLTHFYSLPYKCSLCPYRGRFTESLKMHMRSHTGEKPYQCCECPSRFISKSNLNKHMLTHKKDHDFKCETCGKGYNIKRQLELHIKVDHTGIKDHICNICGKAFGYRKQMMKHQLKVHKREKLRSGRMPIYLQVEAQKNSTSES